MTLPHPETRAEAGRTASRSAEDALVAADRWSLWRTLARGIGHGLANAAQMLALDPLPPRARDEAIERVSIAIARLADVHRVVQPGPVVVAEALDELQAVQRLQAGLPSTELRLEPAPGLPPVGIPAADLAHVLLALVTNAKQAAAGRRAAIVVRAREAADGVTIEIEDDGQGLDAEARDRAFDAYSSGDPSRLGLGLHVARLLCRRGGGDLVTGERPACLRLTLPAWRRPAAR